MLRLSVMGAEAASWSEVGPRLRGAALEVGDAGDAVAIVGEGWVDLAIVERCLHARKHLLYAAGPPSSFDRLTALWSLAKECGVKLAVVNPDGHLPSRRLIQDQIGAALGAAGLIRIHRWQSKGNEPSADDASPGPLVRDLEWVVHWVGASPSHVFALGNIQVHLGFNNGGMALIDYQSTFPVGAGYHSVTVIAANGAAYADDHENQQLLYRGGHPQALRADETTRQRVHLLQDFVDALARGDDLSANAPAWRDAYAVASAVRKSLATREAVPMEDA
jgi:predicted dehydrogenase